MRDRGNADKIMGGYYATKWKNMAETKPLAYKMTANSDLHDMFALNVYMAGEGFSCDPESFETGPIEPKYSTLDVLKKGVMIQGRGNNRNKRKLGMVYTGIDPLISPYYKALWRRTGNRSVSLFADGLNWTHHWSTYVDVINIVLKTEEEVENLGFYREVLLGKLKKLDNIKKRRIVCRYTEDTESCIMDTARLIQGGIDGWEILNCPNGVIEGKDKYGFEED